MTEPIPGYDEWKLASPKVVVITEPDPLETACRQVNRILLPACASPSDDITFVPDSAFPFDGKVEFAIWFAVASEDAAQEAIRAVEIVLNRMRDELVKLKVRGLV